MIKSYTNKHQSLRFRRWSRVGYAVFVSMTCAVTIGVLAVSVSDKSTAKMTASVAGITVKLIADDSDSDSTPEEMVVVAAEQLLITETTNDDAAARGLNSIFSNNQTVISGVKARNNRFFILCL